MFYKFKTTAIASLSVAAIAMISSLASSAVEGTFKNSSYEVCFTPAQDCTGLIVKTIQSAKKNILVQAYSFTSAPIAKALVDAKKQGIEVKVILDKSQFSEKYSSSRFLINSNIPVWNDDSVAIAHNKVMIIDDSTVITGSFNFTKAAQARNAENLMVIQDKELAEKYKNNWLQRMSVSKKY